MATIFEKIDREAEKLGSTSQLGKEVNNIIAHAAENGGDRDSDLGINSIEDLLSGGGYSDATVEWFAQRGIRF